MAEVQETQKQVCRCPQCGAAYRVSVGKTAKCPKCAVALEPAAPAAPAAAPAPARPAAGRASGALRPGVPTAGKRSSARLGSPDASAGRRSSRLDKGRGASSGRLRSEAGDRSERGTRPAREKKSFPIVPVAVVGVIVIVGVGALLLSSNSKPESTGTSTAGAANETFPSYSGTGEPQNGAPDPWAIGSANYKDPEKEKDLDWSKDTTHETEMQKRRSKGFRGELPPESYGQDPKDTGGRPLAGDGTPPPPTPPPEGETPPDAPKQ